MMRRFFKSDKGSSIVEFALVTPLLVFLFVGLVDVGRSMYFGIVAANAARAGTTYGSQSPTTANDYTGMQSAATTDAAGVTWNTPQVAELCSVNGATPTQCTASASGPPVNTVYYVQVTVTGNFNTLVQYPGIPNQIPVSGTSIVKVVQQ